MHSLKELREWFLEDPETRVVAFDIANDQLVKYDENPKRFRTIPKEDWFARPVVEAFAGEPFGYMLWLRKLARNNLVRGSEPAKFITELCSKIQSRASNIRSRSLEDEALVWALRKGTITDEKPARDRYRKIVRNFLSRERALWLISERRKSAKKRLSKDEQAAVLKEFWNTMAQRFSAGDIPEA